MCGWTEMRTWFCNKGIRMMHKNCNLVEVPHISEVLAASTTIALMMEATITPGISEIFYQTTRAATQKTIIVVFEHVCVLSKYCHVFVPIRYWKPRIKARLGMLKGLS